MQIDVLPIVELHCVSPTKMSQEYAVWARADDTTDNKTLSNEVIAAGPSTEKETIHTDRTLNYFS